MSDANRQDYLRALGRRIWSEANDLKRTPEALADETGTAVATVRAVIAGEAGETAALGLAARMVEIYPISGAQLVPDKDDTNAGVRVMRAADSAKSARIFDRPDGTGTLSPYYEYRDTAMSRMGPFKPEWIQPLRVVANAAPDNPDVAFNNGHLMHQLTFFIGEVNFYWRSEGKLHCAELNTGDSNYITPYVPHSFTSRNPERLGLIIAVTYADQLRHALSELSHIGPDAANQLAGDSRRPESVLRARLARQLAAESLSEADLAERLAPSGIAAERCRRIVAGETLPSRDEFDALAQALAIRPSDLRADPPTHASDVVVQRAGAARAYPSGNRPACRLAELARCPQQPNLKGFEITLLDGAAEFRHSLHEYAYNFGEAPVSLSWGADRENILAPGDSAYVRPMVPHAYARPPRQEEGRLAVVRIPGALSDSVFSEYATYAAEGRRRATGEDRTWF
jgi:uncharacterized RmlC-like cupin family protein